METVKEQGGIDNLLMLNLHLSHRSDIIFPLHIPGNQSGIELELQNSEMVIALLWYCCWSLWRFIGTPDHLRRHLEFRRQWIQKPEIVWARLSGDTNFYWRNLIQKQKVAKHWIRDSRLIRRHLILRQKFGDIGLIWRHLIQSQQKFGDIWSGTAEWLGDTRFRDNTKLETLDRRQQIGSETLDSDALNWDICLEKPERFRRAAPAKNGDLIVYIHKNSEDWETKPIGKFIIIPGDTKRMGKIWRQ